MSRNIIQKAKNILFTYIHVTAIQDWLDDLSFFRQTMKLIVTAVYLILQLNKENLLRKLEEFKALRLN